MNTPRRCLALVLLAAAPLAGAGVTTSTDRGSFVAGVDVAFEQDFESFFAPDSGDGGANFGSSSAGHFLPIVYAATNGGFAELFTSLFHNGDSAAAFTFGTDATAVISLGGPYRSVGLDLIRSDWFLASAATYLVTPLLGGAPIAVPVSIDADTFLGLTSTSPFDAIAVAAFTDTGSDGLEVFDNIVVGDAATPGCNAADLAEPFGLLDLIDVTTFIGGFVGMDPIADLNPDGLFDLQDVLIFVDQFQAGCP
ncbi:MAG: hypothetical protein H6810_01170 [Phycisphaeraceae bacterium]|nr:MAG: hypothetical protein H6810_01170 [Phycisphaeraceae bacterium]